jgi:23S rRNA (cytosine1962-C5)-methyltransferase
MPKISIKKGREWQLLRGHPWLFSGAISQAPSNVEPGDIVDLVDTNGRFVARGYFNPACDIAVRVLTTDADEQIDKAFIGRRVRQAMDLRERSIDLSQTNVYRLINAEGDFLPGIIADRFADVIVLQSHTAGGDRLLLDVIAVLAEQMNPKAIIVRNDAAVRKREELQQEPPRIAHGTWSLASNNDGENTSLIVLENSLKFKVDPISGQKTGFFTDQRDKRAAVAKYCGMLPPDSVLANCFSYSGSFAVYAATGNLSLRSINVDESAKALDLAKENFEANGIAIANHEFVKADAFTWLEEQAKSGSKFPFVILDPPAFAKSHRDKAQALKAYTRLNRLGIDCCTPGALLLTCSCSGSVNLEDLESCLQTASGDASRHVQILEVFKHGADHPTNAAAPETQYLKVILCRVL